MNAPVPAPKDPLSTLLILAGLGLGAVAILKLDDLLLDLKDRIWKLENRLSPPSSAVSAGDAFAEELVPEAKKAARPRPVRAVKDQEA